ncbi:MAG: anhydro-N-acetylmuramic acid kinase [Bacteroidetes bacterium]|nr:anhydro-N-acetylmuramic acid kinase [Bacteroidota bacterium]
MNPDVQRLFHIAAKKERLVIGLMSGTSLDGLDIALCRISGHGLQTHVELLQFTTVAYDAVFRNNIKSIFSKKEIDFEQLCVLHPWIALQHARMINDCLQQWKISNAAIDLIASHGQTVFHAPKNLHPSDNFGNATLQIGDGDHLAVNTGIITISDFRQKHIAAGGEGAPLAVYGDYLMFSKKNEDRVLLNIGGIANFTYLPGSMDNAAIFSTDTGPGNTMMDAVMQQHFNNKPFDAGAAVAKQGTINQQLLAALKDHDFFQLPFPKTTGPELFNTDYLLQALHQSSTTNISWPDTMATLNRFTAETIADAIIKTTPHPTHIFTSGGGMHNPLLIQHLHDLLPGYSFNTTSSLHINPDAKEAVLFAVLANECICGEGNVIQHGIKGMPNVAMGKISFPH